ncbi:MAG: hypothetical protein NXI16_01245 [Alphaproteobacteria bacterium]|nr:hypothetical protein [Alphaproteobacteria bacterium]
MTSWTQLTADIQAYAHNFSTVGNTSMSDMVAKFITNAELRVSRDLKVSAFIADPAGTGTLAVGTFLYSKPAGAVIIEYVTITLADGSTKTLERKTLEFVKEAWQDSSATDEPEYWAEFNASQIYIAPTPNYAGAYEIGYRQRLAALSASNQTNWLTENAYDALLAAAVADAFRWAHDVDAVNLWEAKYETAVQGINAEQARTERDQFRAPTVYVNNDPPITPPIATVGG